MGNRAVQQLAEAGALEATLGIAQQGGVIGARAALMPPRAAAAPPTVQTYAPATTETPEIAPAAAPAAAAETAPTLARAAEKITEETPSKPVAPVIPPPLEAALPVESAELETAIPESAPIASEPVEAPALETTVGEPEPEAEVEALIEELPQLSIAPPDEAALAEAEVEIVTPEEAVVPAPSPMPVEPEAAMAAEPALAEATAEAAMAPAVAATAGAPGAPAAPETAGPLAAGETAPSIEVEEVTGEAAAGEVAAEEEAAAEAGAPVLATARSDVELMMPEPPSELSEAANARIAGVQGRAGGAARRNTNLPPAQENVADARGAVDEPDAETRARASSELANALGERPEPSAEIEELCERIREVIRSKRPPDEDSLVEAEPQEMAREAGSEMNESVEGDAERVQGEYAEMNEEQEGAPTQVGEDFETPPESVGSPEIDAGQAVPDEVPEEDVSLGADVEATEARIEEAGMNTEPAQLVESGPIAEAREASGELQETAEQDPAEVLAQQREVLAQANNDMQALQQAALEALQTSRTATVWGSGTQQRGMVSSEQQTRQSVSAEAQRIFDDAQRQVDTLLRPMPGKAMDKWNAGVEVLSTRFKQRLQRVEEWIDERHSGVGGFFLGVADYIAGLPDWVTEEYDAAEQDFGDGVCNLVREISTEVNGIVATCEAIIDNARQHINDLFTNLPVELQEWAAGEQARFNQRLDGLNNRVTEARDNFNRELVNNAAQAVQSVREEIHALREKAKGLIGQIADAINAFLEDPARFIINGLLGLVGIPPASFWALVARIQQVIQDIADDPMNFINNLMAALKQGFEQFFDNIGTHLLDGLLQWLFSGLGSVGVTIPTDFSLKSIITFFLQLMGITWPRIRQLLAKHIGEENVLLIEKAYEIIANLIEMGPEGVFEMIKEQLNPQNILDQVLQAAIDFLIEALIRQVTIRIIGMLNPAGAIFQALELIYRILKWIFENAARIFRFVETIVNGIADIIAGNISGMANAVEQALASLIPPVIDFLAGLLGLGDLPDKIADVIRGFQEWVESILDRVIGYLAEQGRRLLAALGIGEEEEEKEDADESDVRARARSMLMERLSSEHTLEEANAIVYDVFNQLQSLGLNRLEIGTESENGEYAILAEASPLEELLKLAPKGRAVTMAVSIKVAGEEPVLESRAGVLVTREAVRDESGRIVTDESGQPIMREAMLDLEPAQARAGRRVERFRPGGRILPPEPGAGEIQLVTWNTGGQKDFYVDSNSTHAERQFTNWFDAQPRSWKQRVEEIAILINWSPCLQCGSELIHLMQNLRHVSPNVSGRIAFQHWYPSNAWKATTSASLAALSAAGWDVVDPSREPEDGEGLVAKHSS